MCDSYEYRVKISDRLEGQEIKLRNFPELEIVYVHGENHLCPSNYTDVVCFWEGDLTLVLSMNGREITLNDHDHSKGEQSDIETDEYRYTFQGIAPEVENRSRDETYLIFSVKRCPLESSIRRAFLRMPAPDTSPGLQIVGTDSKY